MISTNWNIPGDDFSQMALENLGGLLNYRKVCGLVGAGVAARLGFPNWVRLLDMMGNELRRLGVADQELRMLTSQKDALWRAEEYRRLFGEKRYHQFLHSTFTDARAISPVPEILHDIIGLNWKHVFTTNYDRSLELAHMARYVDQPNANVLDWKDRDAVRDFLSLVNSEQLERNYIHLHGHFGKPNEIVLSYQDYVRTYIQSDEMVERLFVLFSTQSFAFIGFSLEDPDFVQILRQVNSRLGNCSRTAHFAILPASPGDPLQIERRRLVGKYDVEPIFYRHEPGDDHVELWSVVKNLLDLQNPLFPRVREEKNNE